MRRRYVWIGGSVALLAAAGGWAVLSRGPEPTPVDVASVGRQDLQAQVTANGKVRAQRTVDISATIAGEVKRIAVEEGDAVRKGQLLLQIDPVVARAAARGTEASMQALLRDLDAARASLNLAQADFRRAEGNYREQIISDAEFQAARTTLATNEAAVAGAERRVAQARATLEGAEDALAKTTVRAPMDGIVTAKRVEEGEVAVIGIQNSPGTVLLTVSDMSVVEAEMDVDETSIPRVRVGQEARVRIDAYPNKTFAGTVTEVGSSPIDQTGQNEAVKFQVKVEITDPPEGIKPGLSVQADILTGFREQALVVPLQALVIRDVERPEGESVPTGAPRDEEGVYLFADGKARFSPLETGLLGELHVEVLGGLAGGETLITGPFRALRELEPDDAVRERDPDEDQD
jgi:HlyD family secretion protein